MIILDNGHGEDTPGKRSPKGLCTEPNMVALYEFEFNRDIVDRIFALCTLEGIPVARLVPESEDIGLRTRCNRANLIASQHPGSFLISIHANAFNGKADGFEAFTYLGQSQSDVLADLICKQAREDLPFRMRFDTSDGDLDKESRFYILKHTVCPAVLTESGFMDSEKDLSYLITDEGRQEIAVCHYEAIKKYIAI
jgi:N-acetylmuramoyl-L-alanine amidase